MEKLQLVPKAEYAMYIHHCRVNFTRSLNVVDEKDRCYKKIQKPLDK